MKHLLLIFLSSLAYVNCIKSNCEIGWINAGGNHCYMASTERFSFGRAQEVYHFTNKLFTFVAIILKCLVLLGKRWTPGWVLYSKGRGGGGCCIQQRSWLLDRTERHHARRQLPLDGESWDSFLHKLGRNGAQWHGWDGGLCRQGCWGLEWPCFRQSDNESIWELVLIFAIIFVMWSDRCLLCSLMHEEFRPEENNIAPSRSFYRPTN